MIIANHTPEQVADWQRAINDLLTLYGNNDVAAEIANIANKYVEDNNLDSRTGYAYGIMLAYKKLNGPVLDDTEYHEIMKGQEIMNELINV